MKNKKKGFTLIETLASIGIISIVMAAIYSVLSTGIGLYLNGITKDIVTNNVRIASNILSQSIKTARYISTNSSEDGILSSISVETGVNKLMYIEGSDNTRYMLALKVSGDSNKLVKYSFSNVKKNRYTIEDASKRQTVSEAFKEEYLKSVNENAVDYSEGDITNFPLELNSYKLTSKIVYEKYTDKCYLVVPIGAGSTDDSYIFPLIKENESDFAILKETIIADSISNVVLTQDYNNKGVKIDVVAKYKNKEKEYSTIVFIQNYGGIF